MCEEAGALVGLADLLFRGSARDGQDSVVVWEGHGGGFRRVVGLKCAKSGGGRRAAFYFSETNEGGMCSLFTHKEGCLVGRNGLRV